MAIEEGIVLKTDGVWAEVRTIKSDACASCSAKGFCHDGGREMTVSVRNSARAKPGDRVSIEIATGSFLKVLLLLYIVPVLALMAGAFIGLRLGGEDIAAAGAVIGFVLAVVFVRIKGRQIGGMAAYQPQIVRVIKSRPPDDGAEALPG